jgi:hypothetical protein
MSSSVITLLMKLINVGIRSLAETRQAPQEGNHSAISLAPA